MATLTKTNAKAVRASRKNASKVDKAIKLLDESLPDYVEETPAPAPVVEAPITTPLQAAIKMNALVLTPLCKNLLSRAIENTAKQTGVNLPDKASQDRVARQRELLNATNLSLPKAVLCLFEIGGQPAEVQSLCFAVMKAAVYLGNLDYRRALRADARPLHDENQNPDCDGTDQQRDDDHAATGAPPGLAPGVDPVTGSVPSNYVAPPTEHDILQAVSDVNLYLDVLSKSFGAPFDRYMPFAYTSLPDGTFEPIHSAEHALDMAEVGRKRAATKREIKRATNLRDAAAYARRMIMEAGQ